MNSLPLFAVNRKTKYMSSGGVSLLDEQKHKINDVGLDLGKGICPQGHHFILL